MPRCEPSTSKSYEEMSTGYQKTSKSYQKRQNRTPDYRNAIDSRRSLPESPPPSEKRKFRPGLYSYYKAKAELLQEGIFFFSSIYLPDTFNNEKVGNRKN